MVYESLLFLFCWCLIPIFWRKILNFIGIDIFRLSIPQLLFISLFFLQYLGIPFLYFGLDLYRKEEVYDQHLILSVFFGTAASMSFLLIGYVLGRAVIYRRSRNSFCSISAIDLRPYDRVLMVVFLLIGLVGFGAYLSNFTFGDFPILVSIGIADSGSSITLLRSNLGNALSGYYIYSFFMRDILSLASYALFINWLHNRKMPMALGVSVVAMCGSSIMAGEKAPIVTYLFGLVMCYVVVKANSKFTIRLIMSIVITGFLLIGILYMLLMGADGLIDGILQGFSRVFTGSIQPVYHYLEIFPASQDFLLGRSFPNPKAILPFEHYNLPVEVMNMVQPWHVQSGVVGSMPTVYWGELYANFGWVALPVVSALVGILLVILDALLRQLIDSPPTLAIYIWMCLYVKDLAITSLSNYLFNLNFPGVVVLLFLCVVLSGRLARKTPISGVSYGR